MTNPHTFQPSVSRWRWAAWLWCVCLSLTAQNPIQKLEYYLDSDPGLGNGTNITFTSGTDINAKFDIDTSTLNAGMHLLGIRGHNGKRWSFTYSRMVVVTPSGITINAAEYFWDADPGIGKATSLQCSLTGNDVSFDFEALCAEMPEGIHTLGLRVYANGMWSQTYARTVITHPAIAQVSKAEYFWDADPGIGKATSLQCSLTGNDVSFDFEALCAEMPEGIHTVGIRVYANGMWSQTYTRTTALSMNGAIDRVEYFWNRDPGKGLGISMPFTTAEGYAFVDTESIPTDTLSVGTHALTIRARANGIWTVPVTKIVQIPGTPGFTLSKDTVCVNEVFTLSNTTGETIEGTTYEWDMNGDGIAESKESGQFDYSYPDAGTYTITLTAKSEGDVSVNASKEIVVLPIDNPEVSIRGNKRVCPGEPAGFKAVSVFGGNAPDYEWYRNNQLAGENKDSIIFNDLVDGDVIYVKMTTSNPCCNINEVTSEPVTVSVDAVAEGSLATYFPVYTSEQGSFPMKGGMPEGGTYYIDNVETSVLVPSDYTAGTHKLSYRYPTDNGCYGEVTSTLEIRNAGSNSLLLGDVNKDEVVDINDILCAVDIIYGVVYPTYNLQTADVNGDNRIDVSDVVGIIRIISNRTDHTPAKQNSEDYILSVNNVTAKPGSAIPASVALVSNEWIGGAQFDLTLPEGVTLKTSSADVHIGKKAGETGNISTVIAYTMSLSDLSGSLPLTLEIDKSMPEDDYPMYINNGVMTDGALSNILTGTHDGILHITSSSSGVFANEEGITVIATGKKVLLSGVEDAKCRIYDVSGRIIYNGENLKPFTQVDIPETGVYVVRVIKENRTHEFKVMVK